VNGKVLVVGGLIGCTPFCNTTNSVEIYDPATSAWNAAGSMGLRRGNHIAVRLQNGKVLVAGGYSAPGLLLADSGLYDPDTGTWSATGSLSVARQFHSAALLPNGKVLVTGGLRFQSGQFFVLNSAELYDPATGSWSSAGTMNSPRFFHITTLLPNGKVLVASGSNNTDPLTPVKSGELYDPASGSWTLTGELNTGRVGATETLLPNGKVLVAGGGPNDADGLDNVELYDPAAEEWSATGSLAVPRQAHTATLLPNGKVLVVGGASGAAPPIRSAELYDPATGNWTATAELGVGRATHSATLLANGKVLVAAGLPDITLVSGLTSTELFEGLSDPFLLYNIVDRAVVSYQTQGSSGSVAVGYARIQPNSGSRTPAGVGILGFRQNGVLVTEAGVPTSPLIRAARIYVEMGTRTMTGLAIANPNNQDATVDFHFTTAEGMDLPSGRVTIPAKSQIARFLNESPFNGSLSFNGTFTLSSSLTVSLIALRRYMNERSELLITTLPVVDLAVAPVNETVLFPHFSDGGGWTTQILLVNPTDQTTEVMSNSGVQGARQLRQDE
jgi:N-acetylneuraminic acid mutarotase